MKNMALNILAVVVLLAIIAVAFVVLSGQSQRSAKSIERIVRKMV